MTRKLSEFIPGAFHSVWRAALAEEILNIVCKGGRGSGKSSDIAHIIVQFLMRFAVNAVGIRKVDNTIELSIFEQMKWAIEQQGVSHLFKINKNLNRYVRLNSKRLYVAGGAITIERPDGFKTVNNGMSVSDVNIQAYSLDFKSDSVQTVGYWYRTFSLNEQNCNYFRYRHQARYLKVEIGAVNEGGGATIVTIKRGSEGVGNRGVLATYRTSTIDFSNELTLTVDLGIPTGEPLDFYVRLKTTNEAAGARARIRGRWLEG